MNEFSKIFYFSPVREPLLLISFFLRATGMPVVLENKKGELLCC
jgi:hypothetical protein